jgi:Fur family transcriptional regulator, ferric uptake regulator
MATSEEQLERTLREHGHRSTRPRRAIWRVLDQVDAHLTVEEIDARLRATGETVDLASIYRALGLFADLGLVRETHLGDDAARWEVAHPDEHFHLVCGDCGDVSHHIGSLVAQITEHLDDGHGFEVRDVELVVTGRCEACRTRAAATAAG